MVAPFGAKLMPIQEASMVTLKESPLVALAAAKPGAACLLVPCRNANTKVSLSSDNKCPTDTGLLSVEDFNLLCGECGKGGLMSYFVANIGSHGDGVATGGARDGGGVSLSN